MVLLEAMRMHLEEGDIFDNVIVWFKRIYFKFMNIVHMVRQISKSRGFERKPMAYRVHLLKR